MMTTGITRKLAAGILAGSALLGLTGCSPDPTTKDTPVSANENHYSEQYVKLSTNRIVLCLHRWWNTQNATMDCFPTAESANIKNFTLSSENNYSEQYVELTNGTTVLCLHRWWNTKNAVMSCFPEEG